MGLEGLWLRAISCDRQCERQGGRKRESSYNEMFTHLTFFSLHLEHHSNHFAQLVEMKFVRTQCPMTGQHLHARHAFDEKGCKTKHMVEIPHWKTLPVNYPSQSHWAQQTPSLADRWPGICKTLGVQYLLPKNRQPSSSLHEKRGWNIYQQQNRGVCTSI